MNAESKFKDRSARVLLVDPSGAVRQLLSEVAKSVGFTNAQAVASIGDAHNILETEGADWLIVPLAADQPVTGLHTVRMISSFYELNNVRVSLLLDESEQWCLPKAFEFGLMSYHLKPFTKDSLRKDFEGLLKFFESHDWNSTKTSCEYLRRHLQASNAASDLLLLERNLLEIYPGNPRQLVNLAHAQHASGLIDNAKTTLKQVAFIDPQLKGVVDAKAKELFGSSDLSQAALGGSNVLGLESVVIIDSDDSCRATTKAIFNELGVTDISDFADGEQAWAAIDAGNEPSFIVMEWRIPKLSAPLLIQRLRSKGFLKCPVVIQSSLVKASDMPIIREMGVSNFVEKPSDKQTITKTIIWTVQQDRLPTEHQTLETKIRAMIGMKNMSEAENLAARYFQSNSITDGRKNVIRAELAFVKDQFEAARDFAIESLKGSGESIFALNVLGKSLMVLRQYDAALKCFQKAQSLSPMNLERLILMAESQAELGENEKAIDIVAGAKDIDAGNKAVKEGEVRVAIASGSDAAKKMMGQLEGAGNVISYLNNKAVAHAKCGLNEEGIELYQKTLDAVPEERNEMRAVVLYNMALAKIRNNDLESALTDLDTIVNMPESKVAKKSASLKARLQSAVSSKSSFALRESEAQTAPLPVVQPESPVQDESQAADGSTISAAAVQISMGDLCCYLLYKATAEDSEELKQLLSTPPRFKQRKAIERGETFVGADANSSNKAS